MKIKLAEALLRRKELSEKVQQLQLVKTNEAIYRVHGQRVKVMESLDELQNAQFPKLDVNQVTAEYDFYARQLRLIDAKIQQANWTTELDVEASTMDSYK